MNATSDRYASGELVLRDPSDGRTPVQRLSCLLTGWAIATRCIPFAEIGKGCGNCRLATAERELLGVIGGEDRPSSEAHPAWLTYQRSGSSVNLRHVLTHNRQDLKSLAGALPHLATLPQCTVHRPVTWRLGDSPPVSCPPISGESHVLQRANLG
jgi:hypothetical protein